MINFNLASYCVCAVIPACYAMLLCAYAKMIKGVSLLNYMGIEAQR